MTRITSIVGGRRIEEGTTRVLHDPSCLDEVVGEVVHVDAKIVGDAVELAMRAGARWEAIPPATRGSLLVRAAQILEDRAGEIARRATYEEGKPLWESEVETEKAIQTFRYYGELARDLDGRMLFADRPGAWATTVPTPVGPCALVTPWNVPIIGPARKLAPALAAGNTCVVKPAEIAPSAATMLVEALLEAGVPDDVVHVVHGDGPTVGHALVTDERIAAVSFTGSTAVGLGLRRALPPVTRLQAELGGKNPLVVTADADPALACDLTVRGGLTSTGQMCTATSIVYVAREIFDEYYERLVEAVKALRLGPGTHPETWLGPLASPDRLATVARAVAGARARGVHVHGGERADGPLSRGCFLHPAVATGIEPGDPLTREELFGPVLTLAPFDALDEALARIAESPYGLAASICTRDLAAADRFTREVRAGMVGVNVPTAGWELQLAFGGLKESGLGAKEQGREGLEFYVVRRTVVSAPLAPT